VRGPVLSYLADCRLNLQPFVEAKAVMEKRVNDLELRGYDNVFEEAFSDQLD
jgi:hypothetical protein